MGCLARPFCAQAILAYQRKLEDGGGAAAEGEGQAAAEGGAAGQEPKAEGGTDAVKAEGGEGGGVKAEPGAEQKPAAAAGEGGVAGLSSPRGANAGKIEVGWEL